MILRGTQIGRNGHGRYGLLPNRTLFSHRAELPFSGVFAPARMNPVTVFALVNAPSWELQNVSDHQQNRKPCVLTRARGLGVRRPPA